jgi:hypothetical protein
MHNPRANFAPFRYSSGEPVPASSDVQNVDYGTGADHRVHVDAARHGAGDDGPKNPTFNATQENVTSDFGSVRYPFEMPARSKQKGVPVAMAQPRRGSGNTAGFTRGTVGGGLRVGDQWAVPDAVGYVGGHSVDDQNEAALSRSYVGQLGE